MDFDDLTFERVTGADGRPMWLASDGTLLPVVAGGSDEGDGGSGEGSGSGEGGSGEGSGSGEGGSGEGGSGEGSGSGDGAPSADEAAKWKALSRKHEAEAKKLRAETEKLRQATQTDAEKALADAEAKGRSEAASTFGQRLAAAEIKAALTGVVPDPASIVEDLNLAKYVTDDGEVDNDAVAALKKKYEGFGKGKGSGSNPFRQGQQGDAPDKGQLTLAQVERMSPEQIVKARREGRLDDLAKGITR